jgi:hypothetical protein
MGMWGRNSRTQLEDFIVFRVLAPVVFWGFAFCWLVCVLELVKAAI